MRILQIIDSLDIGGAEKMAVNYANSLSERIEFSSIIVTRKEGPLKNQVLKNVGYLFLRRKKTIDFQAIFKLRKYCIENRIEYLHPHSNSYFTAVLLKFTLPSVKILWHDHYGMSEFLNSRSSFVLKLFSNFFLGIISVNYQLKDWAEKELNCKNVIYLPNFTSVEDNINKETILKGLDGKRILCLANLRIQKNHFLLLDVAERLKETHPEWSFHLVGKDFEDEYSKKLRRTIEEKQLSNVVYVYGSKNDTVNIINQADITILTSNSEGLPVALLEYGLLKKPTVTTDVGEIPLIIKNEYNGLIVPRGNSDLFYDSLVRVIDNEVFRKEISENLFKTILENNSEQAVLKKYINWVKSL